MRWYEHVTESRTFKRLDNPATNVGGALTAVIAAVFGIQAYLQNPDRTADCQLNPLRGVYNPARLVVQHKCAQIEGTITHVSKERDGDLHIRMATEAKWLTPANTARQHGDLVVEYMPSDSYPKPLVGDRLRLLCTHVIDRQHGGWAECHPVWRVQPLGSAAQRPIP
jgi:hypothetical protein